jgi:hypothetical protein
MEKKSVGLIDLSLFAWAATEENFYTLCWFCKYLPMPLPDGHGIF